MNYQEIKELVTEFHDYWQKYGNDKALQTDREKAMLEEFFTWLIGKGVISLSNPFPDPKGESGQALRRVSPELG